MASPAACLPQCLKYKRRYYNTNDYVIGTSGTCNGTHTSDVRNAKRRPDDVASDVINAKRRLDDVVGDVNNATRRPDDVASDVSNADRGPDDVGLPSTPVVPIRVTNDHPCPPKKRYLVSGDSVHDVTTTAAAMTSNERGPTEDSFLLSLESQQTTQEICVALLNMAFWRPEVDRNASELTEVTPEARGQSQVTERHDVDESRSVTCGDNNSFCHQNEATQSVRMSQDGFYTRTERCLVNASGEGGGTTPQPTCVLDQVGWTTPRPPPVPDPRSGTTPHPRLVLDPVGGTTTRSPTVLDPVNSRTTPQLAPVVDPVGGTTPRPLTVRDPVSADAALPDVEQSTPASARSSPDLVRYPEETPRTDADPCVRTRDVASESHKKTPSGENIIPRRGLGTELAPAPSGSINDVRKAEGSYHADGDSPAPSNPYSDGAPTVLSPSSPVELAKSPEQAKVLTLFPKPNRGKQLWQIVEIMARRHKEDYFIGWTAEEILDLPPDQRPNIFPVTPRLKKEHVSKSVMTENKKLAFSFYSDQEFGREFREKLRNGSFKTLSDAKHQASILWRKYCPEYDGTRAVRLRDSTGNIIMKRTREKSRSEFEYRQRLRKEKINTVVDQIWSKREIIAELLGSGNHLAAIMLEIKGERANYTPPGERTRQLADVIAHKLIKELLPVNQDKLL